jgi:hypothetical protein
MTGSALTAGLSKEAKTSSVLADGVEVGAGAGGAAVSVGGTSVAVGGGAVSSGGSGVSLGAGVGTGVDVGEAVGGGAHAPRSVEKANKTTRSTLTGRILFMAATLLLPWRGKLSDRQQRSPAD